MPFYGGLSLGSGAAPMAQPGQQGPAYEQIVQQLLQQFPGLSAMQGGGSQTTGTQGYGSPGVNLYSGQPASGGGLFGSTGTGIFEGAQAGQPESVTGGLAAGFLGRSPSQAPLSNTGQPQSGGPGAPQAPMGGMGPFQNLRTPGQIGLGGTGQDLSQYAQQDSQQLLGAPPQQYNLFGPVKQVIGGLDAFYRQGQTPPPGSPARGDTGGASLSDQVRGVGVIGGDGALPFEGIEGAVTPWTPQVRGESFADVGNLFGTPTETGTSGMGPVGGGSGGAGPTADPGLFRGLLDQFGLGQYADRVGQGLGGLAGLMQAYQGFRSGNPLSGAWGTGMAANNISGLLGGPTAGSLLSNLLPADLAAAEAGIGLGAGEAGVGATAGAGAGAASLAGIVATPFTIALTNWLMGQGPESGKARETNQIRSAFGEAWPQLAEAGGNMQQLWAILNLLPPELQHEALPQIIASASRAQGATAGVSQFLSTEGGRHSPGQTEMLGALAGGSPGVGGMDVSPYAAQSGPLTMQAILSELAARDRLDQIGAPADAATLNHDPYFMLNALQRFGGVSGGTFLHPDVADAYAAQNPDAPSSFQQPTSAEMIALTAPGGRMQGLQALFSRLNPQFGDTQLGGMLAQMLPYLGGQVSPEARQIIARQQAEAQQRNQQDLRQAPNWTEQDAFQPSYG